MRILHAFSNWKWTGPAEPAVMLAAALAIRHEVVFACGDCPYPDLENRVAAAARDHGLEVLDGLRLRKHFDPFTGTRDLRRLTQVLRARRFDVVHAHLLNDHLLAGAAARRAGGGARIVRSVYGGRDLAPRLRSALAFRRLTDGVVAASAAAAAAVRGRTSIADDRLVTVPAAIDTARFVPERLQPARAAARVELGLLEHDVAAGIVARVQRHRRFDLLLEGFARAARQEPRLRLVIIGRGTHYDELVESPVQRLGLAGRVLLAGYREGSRYDAVLAALDAGVFLVPGSDGSCRAARELAAAGLPVIATRRPPLPEIVLDGATGLLVDETPDALAAAFLALAQDAGRRRRLGAAAGARAAARFSLAGQAAAVLAFYERLAVRPEEP